MAFKTGGVVPINNFQPDRVMDPILNQDVLPSINQIETHPFHQQIETQKFLQENNIQHQSWSPFAEGKNDLFKNVLLSSIGKKYNKSVAQVV